MTVCEVIRKDNQAPQGDIDHVSSVYRAVFICFHGPNSEVVNNGVLSHGPKVDDPATIIFRDVNGVILKNEGEVTIEPGQTVHNLRGEYDVVHHEHRE